MSALHDEAWKSRFGAVLHNAVSDEITRFSSEEHVRLSERAAATRRVLSALIEHGEYPAASTPPTAEETP